jgi:uncharacterized protein DUF2334
VPFAKEGENEQRKRALRLQERGAVRVLDQHGLTPELLANEILNLMGSKLRVPQLDLNGAETSANSIHSLLEKKSSSTSSAAWLEPLRKTLDAAQEPVKFFFRNDDVAWEDARLFKLLELFNQHRVPIDLAVIPKSISELTAWRLNKIIARDPWAVSVHQHGYAHLNHEQAGRKCEFGEHRSRELQLADITAGKRRLVELFGPTTIESIFTPPWNRCTAVTVECLRDAGFNVLSRDLTGTPSDLAELPVSVDWFAKRKKVPLTPNQIGALLGAAASGRAPIGVMLHHAIMNAEERERLGRLLALLSSHAQARCVLMRQLVAPGIRRAVS